MGLTEQELRRLLLETEALILRSGATAWYVGIGHAEAVVRWLSTQGFRVEGLEGFSSDGKSLRPVEACVADLTGLDAGSVIQTACRVLAEWSDAAAWVDLSPLTSEECG